MHGAGTTATGRSALVDGRVCRWLVPLHLLCLRSRQAGQICGRVSTAHPACIQGSATTACKLGRLPCKPCTTLSIHCQQRPSPTLLPACPSCPHLLVPEVGLPLRIKRHRPALRQVLLSLLPPLLLLLLLGVLPWWLLRRGCRCCGLLRRRALQPHLRKKGREAAALGEQQAVWPSS